MALPRDSKHERQVKAISKGLKALDIEVFWVRDDGQVEVEGSSKWWKNASEQGDK